jgi:hypothetical protein
MKSADPFPGRSNWDDQVFFFGIWRILSIVVIFVLSMPFIPAIRQWEPPVVGGLTGVIVSAYDWLTEWGAAAGSGEYMGLFSMLVVPIFAAFSIIVFVRYAEDHRRRRHAVR